MQHVAAVGIVVQPRAAIDRIEKLRQSRTADKRIHVADDRRHVWVERRSLEHSPVRYRQLSEQGATFGNRELRQFPSACPVLANVQQDLKLFASTERREWSLKLIHQLPFFF
jgi:hypothetical protein